MKAWRWRIIFWLPDDVGYVAEVKAEQRTVAITLARHQIVDRGVATHEALNMAHHVVAKLCEPEMAPLWPMGSHRR